MRKWVRQIKERSSNYKLYDYITLEQFGKPKCDSEKIWV